MAAVKFVTATSAKYEALVVAGTTDASTLYFVTDQRRIYKGNMPFTGGIYKAVTAYPEAPEINTIYVNTTDGSAKFYDGNNLITLVKPQPAAIGDGSVDALATTKAVVDYVASKLKDVTATEGELDKRVTAVEKKAAANESAIGVINGDGEGSIAKALADANAHTDEVKTALEAAVAKKADKATTLEGYGITDAFTKEETNSAISIAVANAHHLKREIVDALPAVEDANADTIYMVGSGEGSEDSAYKEYMIVNGKFELIGDSKVDLTDYATKAYAEEKANEALAAAKADALNKIQALDKSDTAVANQYVSAVNQTDGVISVTRVTLPVYSVAAGKANGTIAVNGTDVAVTGLGSAAYADTDAFDAAGTAATAQAAAESKAKELADAAKAAAITTASEDATKKANAAQSNAIASAATDAQNKADAAKKAAVDEAAKDATSKADQAKADAVAAAKTETTSQVEAAKTAAAEDAKTKANQALSDAKEYADGLISWTDLG